MFTGLINGQGEIALLSKQGQEMHIGVQALFALDNIVLGESIAVNGVCLTVESSKKNYFTAYASAETMKCTNLGLLHKGSHVNLERALALGDRLGGHMVSGHVDFIGHVENIENVGQSRCIRISIAKDHAKEIIPKGSITLDGISLTVNTCTESFLEVNIIPETWAVTSIGKWKKGTPINIETDIIGKYVCNMLSPWRGSEQNNSDSSLSLEQTLKANGFM